jgi:hypothetical protein
MNRTTRWISIAALGASMLGCATQETQTKSGIPGFLGDYSMLKEEKDAAGDPVRRYVSPRLAPGAYQKLMLDAVQFYPAPQASEYVDMKTYNDVRNYVEMQMRSKLAAKVPLASAPGPGVVRVRTAITSVAAETPGLKPYEVLPIGMAFSAIRGRGKDAVLGIEVELLDSVTGERVGAAVRRGTGEHLGSDESKLTLEHLRPLLDKWTDAGAQFAAEKIR